MLQTLKFNIITLLLEKFSSICFSSLDREKYNVALSLLNQNFDYIASLRKLNKSYNFRICSLIARSIFESQIDFINLLINKNPQYDETKFIFSQISSLVDYYEKDILKSNLDQKLINCIKNTRPVIYGKGNGERHFWKRWSGSGITYDIEQAQQSLEKMYGTKCPWDFKKEYDKHYNIYSYFGHSGGCTNADIILENFNYNNLIKSITLATRHESLIGMLFCINLFLDFLYENGEKGLKLEFFDKIFNFIITTLLNKQFKPL